MHDTSTTTEQIRAVLTNNGLRDVPEGEVQELAARFQSDLERAVGAELLCGLSDEQMVELDKVVGTDDDTVMSEFISRGIPHYRDTVHRLTAEALTELAAAARVFVEGGVR